MTIRHAPFPDTSHTPHVRPHPARATCNTSAPHVTRQSPRPREEKRRGKSGQHQHTCLPSRPKPTASPRTCYAEAGRIERSPVSLALTTPAGPHAPPHRARRRHTTTVPPSLQLPLPRSGSSPRPPPSQRQPRPPTGSPLPRSPCSRPCGSPQSCGRPRS